jgi:deazaflavin-dependent oxidoreductase (nitroreductase family)
MSDVEKLPRWLKPMNRVFVALQRLGLTMGPVHAITVPGRKSGALRTTPVSLLTVDGERYIVGGSAQADWVKNARAAGSAILTHGRMKERVMLIDLPAEERVPILRAFPRELPRGVPFFHKMYGLPKEKEALPDAFATLAPKCAVFRVGGPESAAASSAAAPK